MFLNFILIAVGLFILVKGADILVDAASRIAYHFKVSPLFVGLTIVSFGTSAPELLVSVSSALQGSTELAFGNVVGSNIVNTLLILGVSACIYPIAIKSGTVWKELPFTLLMTFLLMVLATQSLIDGGTATSDFSLEMLSSPDIVFSMFRTAGVVLFAMFIIFLYYSFGVATSSNDFEDEKIEEKASLKWLGFLTVVGLAGLGIGSNLTVTNAVSLAENFGVSEKLIGLTIISIGTSLPELLASITAALKKQNDIAVGNIIGSNIFNIGLILSVGLFIEPVGISGQSIIDVIYLFLVTFSVLIFILTFRTYNLGRLEGGVMILMYIAYLSYAIWRE